MIKVNLAPVHVGGIVDDTLAALNLNKSDAAKILGVRRATLSDLVNDRKGLTAEMAIRLEKAFGVSADLLMRLQARYDLQKAREHEGEIAVERYAVA
jgi:addiction module HigA family antidote